MEDGLQKNDKRLPAFGRLRKLLDRARDAEGGEKAGVFEPEVTSTHAYARSEFAGFRLSPAIFSHFSGSLDFLVTFLHQGKKVIKHSNLTNK